MTMQILLHGDPFNMSGYSSAMRDHIRALVEVGIDVKLSVQKVKSNQIELDDWWKNHLPIMTKPFTGNITISYTITSMYKQFPNCYNIGFSYWEISKINSQWVERMNKMDEIWSTCNFALDTFKNCGVEKPMFKAPWPLNDRWFNLEQSKNIHNYQEDNFTFFSMGEFTERKNFDDLIMAYASEFQNEAILKDGPSKKNGTILVIKTYAGLMNDKTRKLMLAKIANARDKLHLSNKVMIVILAKVLSWDQMSQYMNSMDCYISTARGEGMGGPIIQSMALGKPIIACNHTAIEEYHTSPWKIDYTMEPIHSMNYIPAYRNTNAEWARLNIHSLRKHMRESYELWKSDKKKFNDIGLAGQQYVRDNLNYKIVGEQMKSRLNQI